MKRSKTKRAAEVTRRSALGILVGAGTGLAFGCSRSSEGKPAASTTGAAAECAPTPGGEIGPYFADDSAAGFLRSSILSSIDGSNVQAGISLSLTITVLDAKRGCQPYRNAQIDIWHCNAPGVYSDEASQNTASETWLRGYQLTNAEGQVTFGTIVPGWYPGRTTHIHVRARSTYSDTASPNDAANTTQLFFEQTLIDSLASSVAPYSGQGKNPTTNANDHVFNGETKGANVLAVSGDAKSGYRAEVTLRLPITDSGTHDMGPGGPGGPGGPSRPPPSGWGDGPQPRD